MTEEEGDGPTGRQSDSISEHSAAGLRTRAAGLAGAGAGATAAERYSGARSPSRFSDLSDEIVPGQARHIDTPIGLLAARGKIIFFFISLSCI